MMMKLKILILLFSFIISGDIKETALNQIRNFYNTDIQITEYKFSISKNLKKEIQNRVKQKFFRDSVYYWVIHNKDEINYVIMDNVKGKTMPITFIVIFNSKREVIHSSIIKYREGYGGEVQSKGWLSQFNGMVQDSLYIFNRDIAGISGATISVKSITKGINKLSLLVSYIIESPNEN